MNASWPKNQMLVIMTVFIWQVDKFSRVFILEKTCRALLNLRTFHTSMNTSWCINQMLVITTVFIWQIDNLTSCLEFSCSRKLVNPTHLPRSPKFANISYLNERKLMYTPDVNDNDGLYLSFKNWNVKTHDHTYREKVKLKAGLTPGSTKLSICFWTLRVRRDGALLKPFIVNTGDLERMWITT